MTVAVLVFLTAVTIALIAGSLDEHLYISIVMAGIALLYAIGNYRGRR